MLMLSLVGFWEVVLWVIGISIALWIGQFLLGLVLWLFAMAIGFLGWWWEQFQEREAWAIGVLVVVVGLGGWWLGRSVNEAGDASAAVNEPASEIEWFSETPLSEAEKRRLRPFYASFIDQLRETEIGAQWLSETKPEDVVEHSPVLAVAGMQRLSDDKVIDAATIFADAIARLDSTRCGSLLSQPQWGGWEPIAMSVLDSAQVSRWYELAEQAVIAELRQSPERVSPDSAELQMASRAMLQKMPMVDRLKLMSYYQTSDDHTSGETCRLFQLMMNGILSMPEREKAILSRRVFSSSTQLPSPR